MNEWYALNRRGDRKYRKTKMEDKNKSADIFIRNEKLGCDKATYYK